MDDASLASSAPPKAEESLLDAPEAPEAPQEVMPTGDQEAETDAAPQDEEASSERPPEVPEKFWDQETGTVRTDALIKSYAELERRLSQMLPAPQDEADDEARQRLHRALGMPESPEEYSITPAIDELEVDSDVNSRLHAAGFNQEQAQLVYDLAAEVLAPAVDNAVAQVESARDVERLAAEFGGEERWQKVAEQLRNWGSANLSPDVFETLSSTYDGIMAMHTMMRAREPEVVHADALPGGGTDEATLRGMMRDPRYWRDRDPAFIAEVTRGFENLYRK